MIKFKVTPDHGDPYEIEATSRDIYAWEKVNHGKTFKTAVESGSIADMTEMAYFACRRQGLFSGKLPEFALTHDIEGLNDNEDDGDDETGVDPTRPAP